MATIVAQIKGVVSDAMQFYSDATHHVSTTADFTKLSDDVGQLVSTVLQTPTVSGALHLADDLTSIYYPKISTDISNGGTGLLHDLTGLVSEATQVGASYIGGLLKNETPAQLLSQTGSIFKLL